MNRNVSVPSIGILGGGQLGRMFLQNALSYDVSVCVLDPDPNAPCSNLATEFTCGSFNDFDSVINFGRTVDVITVEIEHVNTEALEQLQNEGKKVFPQPHILRMIQDKGLQKEFYLSTDLPSSDFKLVANNQELSALGDEWFPCFVKLRTSGYDGKGVTRIAERSQCHLAFDAPMVVEKLVGVQTEFAVLVSRHQDGSTAIFPAVDMEFHPEANLVEFLSSPSELPNDLLQHANDIALKLVKKLDFIGLLAIEFFLDTQGNILINEIAPRPHNSGHHTIEGNATSQFDQHFRAVAGWAPGNTAVIQAAVMLNLLGAPGYSGPVCYDGLADAAALPGVHIHLYGKTQTKPMRKMGHVTVTATTTALAKEIARKVQSILTVKSH
jgi:5-(carboxyamino)imidazole ribonucleotide synthase